MLYMLLFLLSFTYQRSQTKVIDLSDKTYIMLDAFTDQLEFDSLTFIIDDKFGQRVYDAERNFTWYPTCDEVMQSHPSQYVYILKIWSHGKMVWKEASNLSIIGYAHLCD